MLKHKFLIALFAALCTALPVMAQQYANEGDRCEEITTMSNDVFTQISDMNKERIKRFIRPAAKLYKAECLRSIISRFGGLGRIMQFLQSGGSIWSRLGSIDIGQLLCNAVIDNLPDNWSGDRFTPMPMREPWARPGDRHPRVPSSAWVTVTGAA